MARNNSMTVRSTLRPPALRVVVGSTVAMCALLGALGSSAARAADAASAASAASAAASAATQYTVKPGQSLNDVAIAATQSHDKAVLARAAKAIFDANPSAFMRGDPSLMKLGAVLNLPPLDASGAPVAGASSASSAPAASAAGTTTAPAAVAHQASSSAAVGAPASVAQQAAASATQATGTSSMAASGTALATTGAAASGAAGSTSHPQANASAASAAQAPAGVTGHAWTGAIQQSQTAPAPSGSSESPAAAAAAPASAIGNSAAPAPGTASSAAGAAGAPASAALAASTPHPRFSSLQQLLALKNRVLMDLQRHGFASKQSRGAPESAENATNGAVGAPVGGSAPQAGSPPQAPVHARSASGSAADEPFIGIGGYGIHVPHGSIPVVAAVASAVVAAVLVLVVGFSIGGRKRRAARAAASAEVAVAARGAATPPQTSDEAKPPVADGSSQDPVETEFLAALARTPTSKRALMGLAGHYAERRNVKGFDEIAQRIWHLSGGHGPNWLHIASLGRQLDPDNPLFAVPNEDGEAAGSALPEEHDEAALPEHSAAAQQSRFADRDAEPVVAKEDLSAASSEHENASGSQALNDEGPTAKPTSDEPPASDVSEPVARTGEPAVPAAEEEVRTSAPTMAEDVSARAADTSAERTPAGHDATATAHVGHVAEGEVTPVSDVTESESPHAPPFPADAIEALNDLDMALPPRAVGHSDHANHADHDRTASHDLVPESIAAPDDDVAHTAHDEPPRDEFSLDSLPEGEARADMNLAHDADDQHDAHGVAEAGPEAEGEPMPPPAAVAGLGAARFGGLNLAFDLDLPGAGQSSPTTVATPAQPMFSAEEIARIARNKLELAHEYIALGDVGGARTLIHEVIESNDAGTRDDAHALLATLAPLS